MALSLDQVRVRWLNDRVQSTSDTYNTAVLRVVRQAAADEGYDKVVIRSLVHATTNHGRRRDQPHITVNFMSTTRPRLNQSGHVNIGLCSLVNGAYMWTPWQNNNRGPNYPYHQVYQQGRVVFPERKESPAQARQREQEEERQRQQQAAASGSAAGPSSVQAPRRDGWNPDPWSSESGKRERWAANGQWTSSTR